MIASSQVTDAGAPFVEAEEHFRRKLRVPVKTYRDLSGECHAKAFMIAGATNDAMLADFQAAIQKALDTGTSIQKFRDQFDAIVQAHGWQYRGEPGWRSAVIFNTNMRTSYMAGKWQQAWDNREMMPYLRYVQVQRPTKRPEHSVWHGIILPLTDPFWNAHYPPNGWGCLCTAQSVSDARMDAEGWQVSNDVPTWPGDVPEEWAYNVGKAARVSTEVERGQWEPVITSRDHTYYKRPDAVPQDKPKAQLGPTASSRAQVVEAVQKMLGGSGGTLSGPDGITVGITTKSLGQHLALDRAPIIPLLPEIIADPYEVWLMPYRDTLTGRVELRRRYLKALQIAGADEAEAKAAYTWFIAEYRRGELWDVTLIQSSRPRELQQQRAGILLYGRAEK